ncbi:MAG: S9 family peptidase [Candidatus Zixiibacteriota bacterium]
MKQTKILPLSIVFILAALLALPILTSCAKQELQPPIAKKAPHTEVRHGQEVTDNYYWLRERDNPEVIAYLEAENAYTDSMMKHTEALQEKIFEEMKKRIVEDDTDAPVKIDSFYYYSREEKGKQYKIHCRKLKSLDAPEEILLDVNQMAEGFDYYDLGHYYMSPDHRLMAYTVDTAGGEHYSMYVMDVTTHEMLPDVVPDMDGQVVWANDNKTLFYTTLDEINRPNKLFRHILGHPLKNDVMVFHEKDDRYGLYPSKSAGKDYILLGLWTNNSSEYYFLPADRPTGKFRLIKERQPMVEYQVNQRGDKFYIMTNENATNFKMMTAPVDNPTSRNWQEFIPHRDSVMLTGFTLFANYIALFERENGLEQVLVHNFSNGEEHLIKFPEDLYTVSAKDNVMLKVDVLRLSYQSMITPSTTYDYNMRTRELKVIKQKEVRGGYDKQHYITKQVMATAPDGVKIPISLMYRKGVKLNGQNPLYMLGYGSYGISEDPNFSALRLSLIDRGFVYAKVHVRGGSELGRWWYEDGKLLNKMNTFTDFIACAEYLISEGYTSKEKLVAVGGSAGGLLMGAISNMRPDMFKVILADVPFVDVINTMMDASIPLTVNEYTEWGNPNEKEYYDYMLSYSPYDNVRAMDYPNMLITAGLNDPRVQYWEPAKWTAKLRAMKTDHNRLLLKTNMGAGHMGASGRYDFMKELAFEYAFILDALGITN